METHEIYIPTNSILSIREQDRYYTMNQFCKLLKKYRDNKVALLFLIDMLEN